MSLTDELCATMAAFKKQTGQDVKLIAMTRANYNKLEAESGVQRDRPFTHINGAELDIWDDPNEPTD